MWAAIFVSVTIGAHFPRHGHCCASTIEAICHRVDTQRVLHLSSLRARHSIGHQIWASVIVVEDNFLLSRFEGWGNRILWSYPWFVNLIIPGLRWRAGRSGVTGRRGMASP